MSQPRAVDANTRHREIEKGIILTVVNNEPRREPCPGCGNVGLLFNCHMFRETPPRIDAMCKSCTIEAAGGEEKVWVKSDLHLGKRWEQNGFGQKPERLRRKHRE